MRFNQKMLRLLSLGAGVQSTTVALMAATGDIEPIDAAIFADTGWEPAEVYLHLERLEAHLVDHGIPVHRVTAGDIRADHVDPVGDRLFIRKPRLHPEMLGKQRTSMPVFLTTSAGPGRPGRDGISLRTCTATYKIEPVERKVRDLLGLARRQRWPTEPVVEMLFGISLDEVQRMRDAARPAITNSYPLVDLRLTRTDCHRWMADHGWSSPRSACVGCPFHSDTEWREMRDERPADWADAVEFDAALRARSTNGLLALAGVPYLHESRVPLADAEIDRPAIQQLSLFDSTCEGYCGS